MNTRLEPLVNRHINLRFRPIEILVNSSRGIICLMTVRAHAEAIHPTLGRVPAIFALPIYAGIGCKNGTVAHCRGDTSYSSCRVMVFYMSSFLLYAQYCVLNWRVHKKKMFLVSSPIESFSLWL